jgi:hypothetical protein
MYAFPMEIPIEKKGLVLNGEHRGWFVKVEPSGKRGYLILYTSGVRDTSKGYDHWVLRDKLADYFKELNLEVDWNYLG